MTSTTEPAPSEAPRVRDRFSRGDRIFSGLALAASLTILAALAAVFVFLLIQGQQGFHADRQYYEPAAENFASYVGMLLFGTALAAMIAMVIAVPFAVGVALFLSHYAPRRLSTPIAYVVDLLAAVPSVVFGLWGGRTLANVSQPAQAWLNEHASWLPFFSGQVSSTGRTILTAGVVLAIMVLPITTAICREVFAQTPRLHEEAALALGATRWEMIRYAVFPHARSGMIAGSMLGLGRALGETMAVTMVLSAGGPLVTWHMLTSDNPATIASNIAARFNGEDVGIQSVLLATGLVLFLFTFVVNFGARWLVARSERKFA